MVYVKCAKKVEFAHNLARLQEPYREAFMSQFGTELELFVKEAERIQNSLNSLTAEDFGGD